MRKGYTLYTLYNHLRNLKVCDYLYRVDNENKSINHTIGSVIIGNWGVFFEESYLTFITDDCTHILWHGPLEEMIHIVLNDYIHIFKKNYKPIPYMLSCNSHSLELIYRNMMNFISKKYSYSKLKYIKNNDTQNNQISNKQISRTYADKVKQNI